MRILPNASIAAKSYIHVEHVVPVSLGGASSLENFAWACPRCNFAKSNRIEASDPDTDALVPLFHPRRQSWDGHFAWNGYQVIGLTPCGRATIAMLDLNHRRRIQIRMAEEVFRLFPP
jgi:hypothetical protein